AGAAAYRRSRSAHRQSHGKPHGGHRHCRQGCQGPAPRLPRRPRGEGDAAKMSPVRPVNIAQPRAEFERRPDGSLLVTNPEPLGPYPSRMGAYLEHWSRAAPDRTMVAERAPDGLWRSLSYAEAMRQVRAIAQALLARGLSADRPVMILSDNSIAHLLMGLACLYAGVPYSPVSP